MIFPNFFHGKKPQLGMHGYRYESMDNHAGFIYHPSQNRGGIQLHQQIDFVDIFPTLLNLLGLKTPKDSHGKNILEIAGTHRDAR